MTNHNAVRLVRDLRGTPLTVLMMMMVHGCPTGRNELAVLTTYSERTVQKALAQLELLGLAQNHGRYNGWALTAHAYQGFLGADPDPAAQPELQRPNLVTAEVQSVHLANPATGQDGQNLHLASNATPPEVQNVHLDAASPEAAVRASPELPTRAVHGAREVQNLHLPHATHAPAPASEVQSVHLDTPDSTGEVPNLHLDTARPSREVQTLHLHTTPPQQEVQSVHLPSSSSCSSSDQDTKSIPRPEKPQPQTLRPDDSNQTRSLAAPNTPKRAVQAQPELPSSAGGNVLDAAARAAVALLTATGCPIRTPKGKGALDAVEAALAGGWSGDEVYAHVRDWLDYGNRQSSIAYPGLFTIARVRTCQPAPEPPPKSADELAREHVAQAYARIVRH